MLSHVHLAFHARIQDFSSGESDKKSPDNVFLVLSLFYWIKWLISKKTIIFQGSRRGPTFSSGGGGGVQLLIPYRNPYNLWFSRGSGPPDPPLDPHFLSRPAGDSFFPFSCRWVVFFSFIQILIDHDSISKQWRQATPRADPEGVRGSEPPPPPPPPPWKITSYMGFFGHPTPWKKVVPLIPTVIKPLDPLCKL